MKKNGKKTKRTPAQREAMMYAFWNKWGGGDPTKVERTKGHYEGPWTVGKVTPSGLDNAITKAV